MRSIFTKNFTIMCSFLQIKLGREYIRGTCHNPCYPCRLNCFLVAIWIYSNYPFVILKIKDHTIAFIIEFGRPVTPLTLISALLLGG